METRSVRLNIPELIEEYIFSKMDNDLEECAEVRQRFEDFCSNCSEALKVGTKSYIVKYLKDKELDNVKDLDNLFSKILD